MTPNYITPMNYHDMHNRFMSTPKPPRSKKYNENQRPLRRVTEAHLMLQKDPHSYVVKINGAEVARYFEPDEEGNYQMAVRGLYATYDINLMWQFTKLYSRMGLQTTTGDVVLVPLNHEYRSQDKDFSAVLTFNSSHQLIVEKSWHAEVYKLVSTSEDKDKRKSIKNQLDAYVTLQMFKLPTLKDNAKVDEGQGAPFGEEGLGYREQSEMREYLKLLPSCLEDPKFAELFDHVAQDTFNMLASKKVYATDYRLFWKTRSYFGSRNPSEQADAIEQIEDITNSITPDEFKKSLITRLMKYAQLSTGSQSVALPQFANKLPRTYFVCKRGS